MNHRPRKASRSAGKITCERLELRRLLSVTAAPTYEYLNRATGQDTMVKPLGTTTPGAPLIPATMRSSYGLGSYTYSGGKYTYSYGLSFKNVATGLTVNGDGTGQTIAIVDVGSDPDIAADLQTFDAYYNLPNPPSFQQLAQDGSTNLPAVAQGWPGEISLDVEWSHVMAPGANIILFAASDLYAAVQYAATYPGVSVVSMSFTAGTPAESVFTTPSGHGGVSFFAGNGDTGSEVPSPAQLSNVVAVGGTHLNLNAAGTGYGSESVWSAGGGGVSSIVSQPSYQSGIVSTYSTTQRTTPDVSMDADPGSGVAIVDSYDSPPVNGVAQPWEEIIGGTSLATPLLAGTVAIADQARVDAGLTTLDGGTQLLPRFYELMQANYSANYHDVTAGSNGHSATTGYDLGTGIGTPVANNLIPDLAGDDTISGRAFVDTNGNGTYDAGTDTALSGKVVYLDLNNNGVQDPTDPSTTTDANGLYSFADTIGSFTGVVRLAGSTGYLPETSTPFTTAYATNQTYNLVYATTATSYAATASPTSTTKSTTMGIAVTGTSATGLTYTWQIASGPSGGTATFSPNGTAAAKAATATFNMAGTYVVSVKITNAAGGVATANTTVVVTQVLTTIGLTPPTGLTAGQTEQLVALGYDQFGGLISGLVPPVTWAVTAGGGTVSAAGIYTAPATGTLATVADTYNGKSSTGSIPVVNQPWTSADVGNVTITGTAYDSGTTTTLTDESDDIWNQSDDFHFDYQQVSGDVTIIAKLVSQTSTSTYIKAGIMIRNSLSADDVMAMEADPSTQPGGPLFEWRTATRTNAAQDATSGVLAPSWEKLVRSGTTFTGYSSSDGVNWTQTGTQTLTMGTVVYVGLALTSHDANNSATAVFSNVSITPTVAQTLTSVKVLSAPVNVTAGQTVPLVAVAYDQNNLPMTVQPAFTWALTSGAGTLTTSGLYTPPTTGTLATVTASTVAVSGTGTVSVVKSPWTSTDLGTVGIAGTAYDSSTGTTTLTNASDDIWNQSDDFHFDYQTLTGNGTITAKLNSQTSASNYIKAGVMMRNSLDPADAMVMTADPAPGPLFEWRTTYAGTAAQTATTVANTPPYWVRLTRTGNVFSSYYSANGTSWTLIGSQTISMNQTIYAGLALSSHNAADLATAVFSSVSIVSTPPTVATAASATPSPVTGTTTALSVLGASSSGESNLTYTWAATTVPAGATAPTFSVNGTNASKATTATFSSAGTYTFTVTVTDLVGNTVTSTVSVVVNRTAATVTVSPTQTNLNPGQTQQLTASAVDQFGVAFTTQPTFTYTVTSGTGTVSSTGLYTAPTTGTLGTVTVTSGTATGTTTFFVVKSPYLSVDIGTPTLAGFADDNNSTTTVEGSGTGIGSTTDQFHFDYQTITGNVGVSAELNATPLGNVDGTTTNYANTGIMFRDNATAGASFVDLVFTNQIGVQMVYRDGVGSFAAQAGNSVSVTGPVYLRLLRSGNTYTGYYSSNGTAWTLVASYTNNSVGSAALVGFATTSHDNTKLAAATYSNVVIGQPTVATAAVATPATVTGKTAALSVLGSDTVGAESTLTYQWAATSIPAGSAAPAFSINGTNAAKNTTATFTAAGSYTFTVTITDSLGLTTTSIVNVTVSQTLTSLAVTPATATVADGQTNQFTAVGYDQFGNALTTQLSFTWSVDTGTISTAGVYTAPASGAGTATVKAATGSLSATATVTIGLTTLNGTASNDTIRLVRSGTNLLVYLNNPTTPLYTVPYAAQGALTINEGNGTDTITVDFSGGNPVPAAVLTIDGGAGTDALIINGSTAADTISVNAAAVTFDSATINFTAIESITVNANGGADALTQLSQPPALTFNAPLGTLNVNAGTYSIPAPAAGSGISTPIFAALNIADGASVVLGTAASSADRTALTLSSLTLAGTTSDLDLGGNDLILHNATAHTLTTVTAELQTGRGPAGLWTGPGISSTAAAAAPYATALGAILDAGQLATFDGQSVGPTDILIKFTYLGDANLDGTVDGSDYTFIDNGFNTTATGWANGDFNYDGVVDGSDYTLIDNAFNTQTTPIGPAGPTAQIATKSTAIAVSTTTITDDLKKRKNTADAAPKSMPSVLI